MLLSIFNPLMAKNATQIYSASDLQILVVQKEYSEFFDHVKDIRPTKRNRQWKKQLTLMGQEYIKHLLFTEKYSSSYVTQVEKLLSWPLLKNNSMFHQLYDQFKLPELKHRNNFSTSDLHHFWTQSTQSSKTAFSLIQLSLTKGIVPKSMFNILAKITNGSASTFYCQDPQIQKILLDSFKKSFAKDPNSLALQQDRLVNIDCLTQWKTTLIKNLTNKNSELSERLMIYKILEKNSLLTLQTKQMFLFEYFMTSPHIGDMLNYAWENITILGKSYKQRQLFLSRLTKQRFLPDNLFVLRDRSRRLPLMTHLSQNFPEYIDHYLSTCLDFLNGKKEFPFGNPTLQCRKFMSNKDNFRFIPISYINRYRSSNYSWKR